MTTTNTTINTTKVNGFKVKQEAVDIVKDLFNATEYPNLSLGQKKAVLEAVANKIVASYGYEGYFNVSIKPENKPEVFEDGISLRDPAIVTLLQMVRKFLVAYGFVTINRYVSEKEDRLRWADRVLYKANSEYFEGLVEKGLIAHLKMEVVTEVVSKTIVDAE